MGAAGLPFLIGRLKRNHRITPGIADPAEGLALLYTDSILHDPRVLRFVIEMIGADRVMLGSDCRSRSATTTPPGSLPRPGSIRIRRPRSTARLRQSCSGSHDPRKQVPQGDAGHLVIEG
jgi:hypothetical protein